MSKITVQGTQKNCVQETQKNGVPGMHKNSVLSKNVDRIVGHAIISNFASGELFL